MSKDELILLNSDKVRRDSSLMAFYIETFFETFGYKPNCAGCTFNSDFNKLKIALSGKKNNLTLTVNNTKMENTFKLKKVESKILAFKKGKVTLRLYDTNLNENFVIDFLTHGTEEEIEQRKKLFSKLPKLEDEKKEAPKKKAKK